MNFGTLTFSVSTVEHTLRAGTECEGSFSVMAKSGQLTTGYVHTSDYRMECINSELNGTQDEIAYRFHGANLLPGEDVHGDFYLCTNRGEYNIPFSIHVEADIIESSVGPIRNLFHFTNLAKAKWKEALDVFYDPRFIRVFNGPDRDYLPLYHAMSGVRGSEHNMDGFLVAVGKKTPVEYIPSEASIEITDPEAKARFSLDITRNGWGYTQFHVDCEGDFLSVEEQNVAFEDFLGNKYLLYYYVDSSRLHNGHNFGSITITDHEHRTVIPVVVNCTGSIRNLRSLSRFRSERIVKLMELYSAHRLKKITTVAWLRESTVIVDDMMARDPEDVMAGLYRIHLMITQEHSNEAVWNLRNIKERVNRIKHDYTYLWCYFLYLNSLVDDNPLDAGTLAEEVEYCYRMEPDNWRLCWLLSVMGEEYKDPVRRWEMFAESYRRGCNSPAVFVEAARIMLDNPTMLTDLEGFNLAVIRYIGKQGMMNPDLCASVRRLAEQVKEYSPKLVRLLEFCYKDHPDDELLGVLCTQLIKGNRTDAGANYWYGLGVEKNIRITRLFEYYMLSVDRSELKPVPRPVLLYFSFQSDLDYETNAFLYANVVKERDRDPDMYSRYSRQIGEYVQDQLKAGHNNRYLAILYRQFIDDEMLTSEETAARLADVIFLHEADLTGHPDARRVILCYDFRDAEEIYPVYNGRAYLPVYSDEYCAVIEDDDGNRHVGGRDFRLERLMPPSKQLLSLQLMVKEHTGIDVHYCMEHGSGIEIRPENEFRYLSLLNKNYFSIEFSRNLTMQLMRFYYERDRIGELDALLEQLRSDQISDFDRSECIRYLVKRGQLFKALDWLYEFGPGGLDRNVIGELLYSWLPANRDNTGKYETLICQLLIDTIESGNTNLVSIQFLMKHANASMKTLQKIWLKAGELSADRRDLDEMIIIRTLFTGAYIPERAEVLTEYAYNTPEADILSAALNVSGYVDFVQGEELPAPIYTILTDAFETGLELNMACDLSFVRYYAANRSLIDERIRNILKDCLHRLLAADVIIACFRDLSDLMPSMAPYADATIVEYRTETGASVSIHYMIENGEDYTVEPMNEVYSGVYSKMFILFFGETLDYYITEEDENGEKLTETKRIDCLDPSGSASPGRFGLINNMCRSKAFGEFEAVDKLMEEYYRKDYLTERLFGMHKGRDRE